MPAQTLTDVGIWIAGLPYDFVSNSVTLELAADTQESTSFADEYRSRVGGLKTSTLTLEGFFDSRDVDQFESLGEHRSVLVVPAGQSPGDVAYIAPVAVSGHTLGASVGDLLGFTYAGEGDGPTERGQVFDIREGVTSDEVSTRLNLGEILTGQTVRVYVHVTRRAGRVKLDLESATTGTTTFLTTRATQSNVNSTQVVEFSVAGPVTDEWWQLDYDFSIGSPDFDFAVAVVIG